MPWIFSHRTIVRCDIQIKQTEVRIHNIYNKNMSLRKIQFIETDGNWSGGFFSFRTLMGQYFGKHKHAHTHTFARNPDVEAKEYWKTHKKGKKNILSFSAEPCCFRLLYTEDFNWQFFISTKCYFCCCFSSLFLLLLLPLKGYQTIDILSRMGDAFFFNSVGILREWGVFFLGINEWGMNFITSPSGLLQSEFYLKIVPCSTHSIVDCYWIFLFLCLRELFFFFQSINIFVNRKKRRIYI